MHIKISDQQEVKFFVSCSEQSTLYQSMLSVFDRFELSTEALKDWINQKKENHSSKVIYGLKYKAELIP